MEDDWFSDESLDEFAEQESQNRRANPQKTLVDFLNEFWYDNTRKEALKLWEMRVSTAPGYVEDILWCLKQIVAYPPENIEKIVSGQGNVHLFHTTDNPVRYNDEEVISWLRNVIETFQGIFEKKQERFNK